MSKSQVLTERAMYLNLSTWEHNNEKSLYKLQIFSQDNENLLFLLSRTKDYTCSTEKTDILVQFYKNKRNIM